MTELAPPPPGTCQQCSLALHTMCETYVWDWDKSKQAVCHCARNQHGRGKS